MPPPKMRFTALFMRETTLSLKKGNVHLKQVTEYPFSETIRWEVTPEKEGLTFTMHLRIPTWTGNQFVPGELYSYVNAKPSGWTIKINGKETKTDLKKGFAIINRSWKKGDIVELTLPMPLRYSKATDQVVADRGRVCITRGPLVYAAEGIDNNDRLPNVFIMDMSGPAHISTYTDTVMNGIPRVEVAAWEKNPAGNKEISLVLLPYYAWNNRNDGSMMVWFPESDTIQH